MKKYLYFLMMLACVSFVSCGSDDDNDGGSSIGDASILNGTWYRSSGSSSEKTYESYTFDNGSFVILYRHQKTSSGKTVSQHSKWEGSYTVDVGSHVLKMTAQKAYESEDGINWKQASGEAVTQSFIYSIIDGNLTLTDSKGFSFTYKREI